MKQIIPLTLEWFAKKSDALSGEETFRIDSDLALDLIGINKLYDPFVAYSYKVDEKIAQRIQTYFSHPINLDKFDYFLCSRSPIPIEPRHTKYLEKPVWKTLKTVFKDLKEHGDIKCILDEDYVLGYILDSLAYNNIHFEDHKGGEKN